MTNPVPHGCVAVFVIFVHEFQLVFRHHWWFKLNYPGPLLHFELEFACLSG